MAVTALMAVGSAAAPVGMTMMASVGYSMAVGLAASVVGGAINSEIGLGPHTAASPVSSSAARGVLINAASAIDPLHIIYGSRKVGGTYVIPPSVSGVSNEYLHLVIALCEGEISAINTVYLDDVASTDARFAGLVTIEKYLGTDTQTASAALIAAMPGVWTSAHQGKGVAYLHVQIKADANAFSGLPTITADVDGKKVYDPRDTLTKFSNNPALCIRDYLTSTRYGRGIAASGIDDASFTAAATYCDTVVAIPGPSTQIIYTCDGIINVDDTVYTNIQKLLGSCRGMLVYSGGIFKLVIDKAETPSAFTFNEDNITGAWEIIRPGKRDMLNKVTASYFNPSNNWQPDFSIQDSAVYRALDNGLILESKIDLPFTADGYRAGHIAQMAMKSARFGTVARFSAFQEGLRCEVGDVVNITHSTPGWVAKPFRIMTIDILDIDNVSITAREYDASAYTLDALAAIPNAVQTTLPDMFTVISPAGLTVSVENILQPDGAIIPRLVASWTASTDAHLVNYEIAWSENAGPWDTTSSMSTRWVIPASVTGRTYDVRVRAVNAMGIRSGWLTLAGTIATPPTVGPTAPTFTATGVPFAIDFAWSFGDSRQDVQGTEVWWSATNNRTTASLLSFVPFPSREYRHQPLAPGVGGYYWIRVADTFGNYSSWYPSGATAGTHVLSSTDPTALLTVLASSIGVTQLTPVLGANFIAGLVGGVATLGLNGNMVVDGSIIARNLAAGAVTATKISVTDLSAISANLGTISVGSANIATGAITNAKIGTAAVGTLTIAGNAVTIPVSASSSAATSFGSGAWVTILSATITSTGAPISIIASGSGSVSGGGGVGYILVRLLRDGIQIGSNTVMFMTSFDSTAASWSGGGAASISLSDTPGAGNHTYTIQYLDPVGGYANNSNSGIVLVETKR